MKMSVVCLALLLSTGHTYAKQWTLKDCINHALTHNIQIQKYGIAGQLAHEDNHEAKASLLPSINASTSQNAAYTPWVTSGISSDGYSRSSIDKTYYNGSYNINANWTVWDGNKRTNTIRLTALQEEKAQLDSAVQARNIQEQIMQLYVQIGYSTEAVRVNEESLKTSQKNEERGMEMLKVGKMSKADLAQLTAQRAQDAYNLVAAQTSVREYKRQLKQVLQITDDDFDVNFAEYTDDMALRNIPLLRTVYENALLNRPEIKAYENTLAQDNLNIKIAQSGKLPTLSLNAGVSTSTTSMNNNAWGNQIKQNLLTGAGFTVSIPIFDNRRTKTAVNKANLSKQNTLLDLKNEQVTLYANIEKYWLQAVNNQDQFKAAHQSTISAQINYDLLNEQFALGLKNIVELMTGKDNLLKAQQNELQAKYLAILNINMLDYYNHGVLK